MAPDQGQSAVYNSVPGAVMPSVLPRAAVACVPFWIAGYVTVFPIAESAAGLSGAVGGLLGFLVFVSVSYLGYSRRKYAVTDEGVVESKWVFGIRRQSLQYDDIEEIRLQQSWVQSRYGVGTIHINPDDRGDIETDESMKIAYVETPETAFSNIRSAVTTEDPGVRTTVDPGDINASWESGAGSLTTEGLAAETSSRYHAPVAIIEPSPASVFLFGARFGVVLGLGVTVVLLLFISPLFFLLSVASGNTAVTLAVVALIGLVILLSSSALFAVPAGLLRLWQHDVKQYELYQDHIRTIEQSATQTVQYDEFAHIGTEQFPLGLLNTGWIRLSSDEGRTLVEFAHVDDPAAVERLLRKLVAANVRG